MSRTIHSQMGGSFLEINSTERFLDQDKAISEFADIVEKFRNNPKKYAHQLQIVLNNQECKNRLRNHSKIQTFPSFDTYWDGARVVMKTLHLEGNERIIKADLELIVRDLEKFLEGLPTYYC